MSKPLCWIILQLILYYFFSKNGTYFKHVFWTLLHSNCNFETSTVHSFEIYSKHIKLADKNEWQKNAILNLWHHLVLYRFDMDKQEPSVTKGPVGMDTHLGDWKYISLWAISVAGDAVSLCHLGCNTATLTFRRTLYIHNEPDILNPGIPLQQ